MGLNNKDSACDEKNCLPLIHFVCLLHPIIRLKQEVLADPLGISQQSVSDLLKKEAIDPKTLDVIAKALEIPVDVIKNWKEDAVMNIINFTDFKDNAVATGVNNNCEINFNPLDKYVEVVQKNEKLYEELLKSERDKIALYVIDTI